MHVLHGVVCHVWLYVWDVHCVYVYMFEENELGVFLGVEIDLVYVWMKVKGRS